jgi:uncharacterized protein YndB with AHSA1/START domain
MTWPLIVLVAIVALIVLPIIIGFLMPERYEGTTTVEYDRSVEQVWDALQDVAAHPMTGAMAKSVEALPWEEGRPTWKEDMGRGEVITVRTTAFEPPHHMIREMTSAAVNMTSRWEYELEMAGRGCQVTLSGITDIKSGTWHTPIFRVMMVLGGGVKKGLDIQLDMVAATLETEAQRT